MLKEKMTRTEMLQHLKETGHDTTYFDPSVVQEIATTSLGFRVEISENKEIFIR